jgi:hypothetical protein
MATYGIWTWLYNAYDIPGVLSSFPYPDYQSYFAVQPMVLYCQYWFHHLSMACENYVILCDEPIPGGH